MASLVRITAREQRHLDDARRHGIGGGFTVPNHVPGEVPGSASFGLRAGRDMPERMIPAVQALGNFAFEAARLLSGPTDARFIEPLPLSDRQRDCVLLVALGNCDAAIAARLGIGRRTVNEHVEAAKRRYGVATRAQLVVRALLRCEISFGEVVAPRGGEPR
jgi:LuxR family quorum-sensing system transcriptional regulator CciR